MKKKSAAFTWGLAIAMIAGFFALAWQINTVHPLDVAVSLRVAAMRSDGLTAVMRQVSNLVSAPALMLLSLVLLVIIRQRKYYVPLLSNLAISVVLNLGLKDLFTRPRPVEISALVQERGYSFPSGHSMAAAAFFGFLIFLVWRSQRCRTTKRVLTAGLLVVIIAVGFSRIYLGVHYLSDVLAGFMASGVYLLLFTSFVDAYFVRDASVGDHLGGLQSPLLRSFAHAIDGIIAGLKAERNMVIHFGVTMLVIVLGFLLRLRAWEWTILIILFALVLAAELINTAVEAAVDLISPDQSEKARLAKDTAAGAVLLCALAAAVVGVIILGPKLIRLILLSM